MLLPYNNASFCFLRGNNINIVYKYWHVVFCCPNLAFKYKWFIFEKATEKLTGRSKQFRRVKHSGGSMCLR